MHHIDGINRDQITMFPEALDDYISEDNPVRFIDAFVGSLDLSSLGFQQVTTADTGRPPYHPGDLLRLYIYGYLNHVRSSRRLEKETNRNVELMWLLRRLIPDFKTIADFRRDNHKAIQKVCRSLTLFCRECDLFGGELIAIEGSKFKAVNSRRRNFSKRKLNSFIKKIDQQIEDYLNDLDENDDLEAEVHKPTAEEIQEKIDSLKERKGNLGKLLDELESSDQTQVSFTDPDSRSMPLGQNHGTQVGYNVQVSVDDKHKLILDHNVTNEVNDFDQLERMATLAKEILQVDELEVLADKGYYDGGQIKACLQKGIIPTIPKANTSANRKKGLFTKRDFRYDRENDCYWCPAGERMTFRFQTTEKDRQIKYYATSSCRACKIKHRCTRSKDGRRITRLVDEDLLDEMQRRIENNPDLLTRRKAIVEHPFGTIKLSMDQGYFLMKGIPKTSAETSLSFLAYNIKRAINILGVPKMIEALG
ncbi:MAG: IS1182 family transposase [Anaerolineales bacterium]